MIGKQMGKNHLAAFSMVNSFVMQTVMGLVFFVGSISSTVSRLKAAKKHLEIGQVINTAVLISVVWSIIVTPVLYLIMVRTVGRVIFFFSCSQGL
jgi:Na+-driven multidrug efflux pump